MDDFRRKAIKLVLVMLCVSAFTTVFAVDNQTEYFFPEDTFRDKDFAAAFFAAAVSYYGEEYLTNLEQARINDNHLMALFGYDAHTVDAGDPVYPDFIGGIYYNDNGNMVVQIVEDFITRDAKLYSCVEDFIVKAGNIIVENVQFSINEIDKTNRVLDILYHSKNNINKSKVWDNIISYEIDTINNRIVIYLKKCNMVDIVQFRSEVLNSPMIVFDEADEPVVLFGTTN